MGGRWILRCVPVLGPLLGSAGRVSVIARRRASGPPSGRSELPPAELFDGHVVTRMAAFVEPGDPPGGHAAFRRLKSAQHVWLLEHGYEGRQGHMDWSRFGADHNRPAYYGGPLGVAR